MPQPTSSPNDPLNWSPFRKFAQLTLLSFITALTAATSNDAGATQDSLNEIYGISYDSMNTGAGYYLYLLDGHVCFRTSFFIIWTKNNLYYLFIGRNFRLCMVCSF